MELRMCLAWKAFGGGAAWARRLHASQVDALEAACQCSQAAEVRTAWALVLSKFCIFCCMGEGCSCQATPREQVGLINAAAI